MEGVISLGVGEPDFDTPWHIREAAIYSIESGKTHYTANQGLLELREEICLYQKRRFQLEYDPVDNVIVTVGGSEAIDIAMRDVYKRQVPVSWQEKTAIIRSIRNGFSGMTAISKPHITRRAAMLCPRIPFPSPMP